MVRPQAGKGRRSPAIPDDRALLRGIRAELLRARLSAPDPARIVELLAPLYPRETYGPDGTLHTWERGLLGWVEKRRAADPATQAGWRSLRAYDRRILSLMNRVRAAPIGGAGRKARILAELDAARLLPAGAVLRPAVPGRGEGSALAWVGPMAAEVLAYLATVVDPDTRIDLRRLIARILRLASGQAITRDMVRDRIERPAGLK